MPHKTTETMGTGFCKTCISSRGGYVKVQKQVNLLWNDDRKERQEDYPTSAAYTTGVATSAAYTAGVG